MYDEYGGDLAKLSAKLQVKFKPAAKVKNAEDFARQMLSGVILAE